MVVRVSAVLLRLQPRWRAWIGVVLLAGVAGGVTIASLAGARRTETAYARFLNATDAFDAFVSNGGTTPDNLNRQFDFDTLERLPDVAEAARLSYYFAVGYTDSGRALGIGDISLFAPSDGRFGEELNRFMVVRGRLARTEHEMVITRQAAERYELDVGDTLHLHLYGPEAMATAAAAGGEAAVAAFGADGPTEAFAVVGVVATQGGFPPATGGIGTTSYLSSAYARSHPDAGQALAVTLVRGVDGFPDFQSELERLGGGAPVAILNATDQSSVVQRRFDVEASALRAFGVLAAVTTALLVAQAFARQSALEANERGVLRALGMGRSELVAVAFLRALVLAGAAAAIALAVAVGLSALTPFGVARDAELHPGVAVNIAWVVGGVAAVGVVVLGLGTATALWSARSSRAAPRPSRQLVSHWVGVVVSAGGSAPAVVGTGMALEPGRGRAAVPVRSTLVGATLGVAVLAVVLTFSASLGRLFGDPALYGWNWDVQVGDSFTPELGDEVELLASDPSVDEVAAGTIVRLQIGALRVYALGAESVRGAVEPIVVEGRAPTQPDEILLERSRCAIWTATSVTRSRWASATARRTFGSSDAAY